MPHRPTGPGPRSDRRRSEPRLLADGGTPDDGAESDESDTDEGAVDEETTDDAADRSNVDVMDAGEAEPADPKWREPDIDDIPEFEVRAEEPVVGSETTDTGEAPDEAAGTDTFRESPTADMPNEARAPGATTVSSEGTEAYVAALELCARLPGDVALPEEAADLVPAAVEAELEQDIQSFAAAEFDNPRPHVDALSFEKQDGEVWLRIRIGLPAEGFDEFDPEQLRSFALQELEGVL